ncbi:DNA alkylation repair protein [Roseivirga misakiensis]|uniref:DNA alkylation repair protein n=1 Tax=Roseivirga misakiensis TaxID=1563681 RepID=A0A1E5SL65_9BACT|nr:DNA alkylation repair protein [Roseivirga misakiensis]OEJ99867.1 DNA alkylation repair protein [Roseivirga misakiensis]
MTLDEVMTQLAEFGDERTKNTLIKHGAKEPFFGVKVADLKKILKNTKKDHELSLALYDTGNSDAMYLAGLMADESKISEQELDQWADQAYWYYLSEYAVPWVAAETPFGFELGLKWIESKEERIAAAGWSTLASFASVNTDDALDIQAYSDLLDRAKKEIDTAQNRVKYTMNGFVIAIGTYIEALTDKSVEIANEIGKVEVLMGGTACKVPLAKDYIKKVMDRGSVGKKRKTARC